MFRVAMGSCLIVLLLCGHDRPLAVLRTVRHLPTGGHSVWSDSFTELLLLILCRVYAVVCIGSEVAIGHNAVESAACYYYCYCCC